MSILSQNIAFVKDQRDFHRSYAAKLSDKDRRKNKHLETAQQFSELLEFLQKIADERDLEMPSRPIQLNLTPKDLEGLPDEQIEELSFSSADQTEFIILAIFQEAGGIMSLDQVIVGLYKETEELQKRSTVTSRLYRMVGKGLLFNVPGKKGVYSLEQLSESDVERLFSFPKPKSDNEEEAIDDSQ